MDTLNIIWNYVLPIGGGITVGALIAIIAAFLLKRAFNKVTGKLDVEKIEQKAVERGIEKIKEISFTQTIQPVLESGLRKVSEEVMATVSSTYGELQAKYDNLIQILVCLSAYFDNSVGVPDEAKERLKAAIAQATNAPVEPLRLQVVETVTPTEKSRQIKATPSKRASKADSAVTVER